jgi:hypothetical protein
VRWEGKLVRDVGRGPARREASTFMYDRSTEGSYERKVKHYWAFWHGFKVGEFVETVCIIVRMSEN